jgi:DNA-binding transcriptional ArsR family regulator
MEERATGILVRLGGLLSEPARARMLLSLMDGRQRPATELAQLAGVTPQTASEHLRLLVDSGALSVAPQGRHRYYRLASDDWAETLETMAAMDLPNLPQPPARGGLSPLAQARLCYKHLAGRLGVAWAETLQQRDWLHGAELHLSLNPKGLAAMRKQALLGADEDTRRLSAKPCLDWTERRHHLAGPLANLLTERMLERRWLIRSRQARVLLPTVEGERGLRQLGVQFS